MDLPISLSLHTLKGQAVENMDELVASYRDLVRTNDVDLTAARELEQLQIAS